MRTFHFFAIILLLPSFLQAQSCCDQTPLPDFKTTPSVAWKFKSSQPFFGTPVIADTTVYIGGMDSTLYALDITTGKVIWKFKTGGPIRSTVTLDLDELYLNGGDGNLYCLNHASGVMKWVFKSKAEKQYDPFDYFQSSPTLVKYSVYFGSGDGNIYAVNKLNGQQIWSFQTGDIVHTTPAIFNAKLFAGSFDGYVYCIDDRTGSQLWKFKSIGHQYFKRGEMEFPPTAADNMVFIGGRDYNLYALNGEEGYCLWNKSFEGGWVTAVTPSQKADSIIYVNTSDDKLLLAMNRFTGEVKWKTDAKSNIMSGCALSGTMGYYGTLLGKIYGFDKKTGKVVWSFNTDGYNANHLNYYKPDDTFRNDIRSIIKSDVGFISAQYKTGGIYSSPAVGRNMLVVSSTDGMVYCLKQ